MDWKGGLGGILQQAGKMREQVSQLQETMGKKTVEGSAGAGMVKVVANGKQQILSITLDPEVMKMNDRQMLQDLIVAGVNQAIKASQELMNDEMKSLAGGLGPLANLFKS